MSIRVDDAPTASEAGDDEFAWSIYVVHHDTLPITPTRCTLRREEVATFRRGSDDFGVALPADLRISRKHCRFHVDGVGALFVVDEGSRNGVYLHGARVCHAVLAPGDVLRVGGFLAVVQPTAPRFDSADDPLLPGIGAHVDRLRRALREHQQRCVGGLVLRGEAGVDVPAVARRFSPRARIISPAHDAPPSQLADALLGGDPVVLDATGAPPTWQPPPVAAALPNVIVEPLRVRREDIPSIVSARWRATGAPWHPLTCAQMTSLLLAPWPGNDVQLAGVADALAHGDAADLGEMVAARKLLADAGLAVVARDGSSFRTPAGANIDLRPRPVLARVLRSLCASEAPRTVEEITKAAWPGARLVGESGAARVYSAVATLRRLGLREALIREGEGYRLDPHRARVS